MSRIKDFILWRQEIDSQDDPDMEGPYDWEFPGETEAPAGEKSSSDLADYGKANPQ
jgi:hypothetical protein